MSDPVRPGRAELRVRFASGGVVQVFYRPSDGPETLMVEQLKDGGIQGDITFEIPAGLVAWEGPAEMPGAPSSDRIVKWKVPFRRWLAGCWTCFAATVRHRLAGSPPFAGCPS